MDLLQWKVVQVIPEAKDTLTYVLEPVNGQTVAYDAGQFLTFLFDYYGQEVRRSYSMGSAPGIDPQVFITVKKKENGAISRYVLEHWREGTVIQSLPPSGRFTLATDPAQTRSVCFLAAGSGIVPVFGLLKKLLHAERHTRIVLFYQNHDEQHIIYHEALQQLRERYADRFIRVDLLSHPLLHHLPHQRLNNGLLELLLAQYLPNLSGITLFYTCGPASFMRMVQFTLRLMGIAEAQICKEHFTIDPVPPPAFTLDEAPRTVQLKLGDRQFEFTVSYPTTILQAALNHHIQLPYSCRGGRCSTCTARCHSGTVKMSINDVLTEKDLQKGLVLTCVGYAVTNLVLEL